MVMELEDDIPATVAASSDGDEETDEKEGEAK